jgi:hypothetical protein
MYTKSELKDRIIGLVGVVIFFSLGIVFFLRFTTAEDTWICRDGRWVKHGYPSSPAPATGCGITATTTNTQIVGGDRDEHGCIGSAGYSWCEFKQDCLRPWEESCDPKINFTRSGVAGKNNPGMLKNALYIIYEEPGKPAQSAILSFDANSLCGSGGTKTYCMALSVSDYGLSNGRRISVEGVKEGKYVTVRELELQ